MSDWPLGPQEQGGFCNLEQCSHLSWTQALIVTNQRAQQSQPGSSLLVCVAQRVPVLPQIIHPSHPLTVLCPGIVCEADGSARRLLGIPTSGLMPPDWERAYTTPCSPQPWFPEGWMPCEWTAGPPVSPWLLPLGLGPVRAKAKGCQTPKPPHVSAKQG